MDRVKLVDYLSALTDAEFNSLVAESRATDTRDIKALIERELNRPALNSPEIERRALD